MDSQNGPPDPKSSLVAARRRLLKGGFVAAPVVMTVASRPVLGQTMGCATPSRALSGTNSNTGGTMPLCHGKSITHWISSPWPTGINKNTARFHDVFWGTLYANPGGQSRKMHEVLSLSPPQLGSYFVAAWLNVKAGYVSADVFTEPSLKNFWADISADGSYSPFAGAPGWNPSQVITYFNQSGIVPA